jgi:hypothetical protein
MRRLKYYRVIGINRQSGEDTVRVEAASSANARIKAERHGIQVTGVRRTRRPPAPPAIKPWWQYQTLKSTGFRLPKGAWWFTLLVALPCALMDAKNPLEIGFADPRIVWEWIGEWTGMVLLIFALSLVPSYVAWRLTKQKPGVAGNTYIIASVVLAGCFVFASMLRQGMFNS